MAEPQGHVCFDLNEPVEEVQESEELEKALNSGGFSEQHSRLMGGDR